MAKIVTQATVCSIFDPVSENSLSELLRFWSHRQSPEQLYVVLNPQRVMSLRETDRE